MQTQDLINQAGKTLSILQSGESFNTDELNDALPLVNSMLENWNTQGLEILGVKNFQSALTANQTTPYAIGPAATFDTARPVKIESANIIQSNGLSTPLELVTSREYSMIPHKAAVDLVPLKLWNDNAFPSANLYLWPWASGTPTLDLWIWQQLADALGLTDTLNFAPGYYAAVRYNLAVELLALFPRPNDSGVQVIMQKAAELKGELRALQASNRAATEDPPQPNPPVVPAR